tara:strand:+ start:46799 stop:46927 length:129 start_codon:yes stop_codon:yes gene_type:complete
MSEEVVTQELEQKNDDSCVDAIAAVAFVCLFVAVVIFWVSNQ